jgi:hypothetical protein
MMRQTVPMRMVPRGPAPLWRWPIALLVSLVLSVGVSLGAQAATTWTVCASGCDYSRIQAAIAAPTTLDGDTLAIAAGTYTEAGITVTKSLIIQGEDAASTIVQAAATPGTASDGVFWIRSGVTVTLQDLTIRYGRSAYYGGGVLNQGTLTLLNSTITNNRVAKDFAGGGLSNLEGTLTLINSTISDNAASASGGLENFYGTATLINSTISDNAAADFGAGGLGNYFGTLTLTNSIVHGNTADSAGGIDNNGTMTVTSSTVSGNIAGFSGGILNNHGTLTLINSTVSGNTAIREAGGVYNNHSTLTLINSTVSGNTATYGGGLENNYGTLLMLTNSIVAKNAHGGDCLNFSGAIITSHGYNLDSDGSCRLTALTDRPGVDPLLGPLQDNGGATLTHALLPGSPAIDAIPWGTNGCGTTLIGDQRGQARPQPAGGACDIGAYEVEVAGQALGGWVTGFTPHTVTCQNVTTAQVVTLKDPASPWDCEAAGLRVTPEDRVTIHVRGPVEQGATDVGGAVTGMTPTSGGCANRTTGQQMPFQHLVGATAASCMAAGLVAQPGETVQIHVQGAAE